MDGESQSHPGGADGFEQGSIVADPRQRRILAILRRQGEPIPTVELGTRLAASDESAAAAEQVELDLRHRCLPKLESVGWVERRPAGVCPVDPLPLECRSFDTPPVRDPDDPLWDVVGALLTRPYREAILSTVAARGDRLTVDSLAACLRDEDAVTWADDDRTLALSLHHVDLPKLSEMGAVAYDRDERTVAPVDRLSTCVARLGLDV